MFIARNQQGAIYGAWSVPQTEAQRAQGARHPDWLPDNNAEVVAFLAPPPPRTPAQRLAATGLTVAELRQLLGLE